MNLQTLKILSLATTFPRWEKDTEPPFVLQLNQTLAARGHEITVLVPHAEGASKSEQFPCIPHKSGPSVNIIRFPYWPYPKGQKLCYNGGALPNLKSSWTARFNLPFFLFQQRRWIRKVLSSQSFDLIHSHWILPQGYFSIKHKIPVVLSAHAGDIFPLQKPGLKMLLRKTIKSSQGLTANSQATAEEILKVAPGSKPRVIPMGVYLEEFASDTKISSQIRESLVEGKSPLILNVGRFAEKKGQTYLLQAMPQVIKKFPEVKLAIIGFGPLEENLKSKIKDLGIEKNIIILGKIPHHEMSDYFAAADIFVLPSIVTTQGDTEGLGVVLLEAIAAGTPVIASSVGGIVDIVKDEKTGLLVEEKNPKTLSEAILRLLKDKTLSDTLVKQGQKHLEETFSWESIADKFEEIFYKIRL